MTDSSFFSPVVLHGPFVTSSELWVSETGPEGTARCDVVLDSRKAELQESDDSFILPTAISVSVWLHDEGEGGQDRMRARVELLGEVSMSKLVSDDCEAVEDNLRLNAVSLFYSFARSYIEQLTSMSPMGRFSIPAIDPRAYLDSLYED